MENKKSNIKLFPVIVTLGIVGVISMIIAIILEARDYRKFVSNSTRVELEVSDFDKVSFDGVSEIEIIQGDKELLIVSGPKSQVDEIKVNVDNRKLKIKTDDYKFKLFSYRDQKPLKLTLYVKELNHIKNSGVGEIYIDKLESKKITIINEGVGEIRIDELNSEDVNVRLDGAGLISLSGETKDLYTIVEGVGEFDGFNLKSDTCKVLVDGLGSAEVDCNESLDASIEGMGEISYQGNPTVKKEIDGLGEINQR